MRKLLDKLVALANSKPFKKGFTLTELLVVVLVIGVLAAIALPSYTKSVKKSRASDALNNLNIVSLKQQDYMLNNEKYAENFKDLNVPIVGLTGDSATATVGTFQYTLSDACISASNTRAGESYTFSKNVETQQVGCQGDVCSMFADLVTEGDVGCEYAGVGGDDGSGITPGGKDCGDCTMTCCDGSTVTGQCNTITGQCYNYPTCPICDNGPKVCQTGETKTENNCVYTCSNDAWNYSKPVDNYHYNSASGKCEANVCPASVPDGTVQKNTIDGVHYCRTYTGGVWAPSGWTQKCS